MANGVTTAQQNTRTQTDISTSTMGSAEHTADEAGGEAVFSSDGLPPLSTPLPPHVSSNNSRANDDNDENADAVIEESPPGVDVFQSFRGSSGGWAGLSSKSSTDSVSVDTIMLAEDPLRTLFRLRAEVDRLEEVLASDEKGRRRQQQTSSDANEQYQLQQLKSRLGIMLGGNNSGDDITLDKLLRGRQEDLSRIIAKHLTTGDDLSKDMDKLNIYNDDENNNKKNKDGKIVYELYSSSLLGQQSQNPQQHQSSKVVMLEERLLKLETILGSNTTDTTLSATSTSLLQRLDDAERLMKDMDMNEVEKLAAKAKVIRADLEAAARARAKLFSSSSSSSRVNDEDARTLTALHNHLVELEGISAYLPQLTVRLTELSNLHSNAAEFDQRLNGCEEAVNRSEKILDSVEVSLKKMEEGWKRNLEVVEKNVKRLDDLSKESA
jgi:hypothetical protein